jgi:hypothetical protein
MLGEQAQAGELYPLVRELIDTGAVVGWPIPRYTQTGRCECIDVILVGRGLRKYLPGSDVTWMFGQHRNPRGTSL